MSGGEPSWDGLADENAELRRQLSELRQQHADLEQQHADLERQHADLERQHADLVQEKHDLDLLIETNIEHSDLIAEELLNQLDAARTLLLTKIARLRREIYALQQEILRLQKERHDLEVLLETNINHADSVEEDLLRRVELTLRESERRFRLISETIPVPITVSRAADHAIVYANEPASALFGIPVRTLCRHYRIIDFYPPTVQHDLVTQMTARAELNNYEVQGRKCDGALFYGTLYARPLTFNAEACLLCAIYDMTERKRAENEIRVLNEDLEARVQRRTRELEDAHARIVKLEKEAVEVQMAGGFAHEMRNALVGAKLILASAIDNDETLCQKNTNLLEQLYDVLAGVLPAGIKTRVLDDFSRIEQHEELLDTMLRMINHALVSALGVTTLILEYSRLGRATVGDEQINLGDVIRRIVHEHQAAFREQGIDLQAALQETAALRGHESHFHSIINNIVLNAYDELRGLDDDRQRRIDVRLYQDGGQVIVMITDTANGIPADLRSKIFEPFFSTKPTTGTGLGLSFVSKLVPLYGGEIQVTSHINAGTTFRLNFPTHNIGIPG